MTFPYLICFILFDIDLLVAAQNFASLNLRNSDFSFVLLKYQAIFSLKFRSKYRLAVNFAKFPSKICENKERNSPNFVCITFAQYCKLSSPSFSNHLKLFVLNFFLFSLNFIVLLGNSHIISYSLTALVNFLEWFKCWIQRSTMLSYTPFEFCTLNGHNAFDTCNRGNDSFQDISISFTV